MTAASGAWSQAECDPGNHKPWGLGALALPMTADASGRRRTMLIRSGMLQPRRPGHFEPLDQLVQVGRVGLEPTTGGL